MLIIDLREENEILNLSIKSKNKQIKIFNIPSRFIYFNQEWIKEMANFNKIGLLCATGNRANQIKELYFDNIKNINIIKKENDILELKYKNSFFNFGFTQYIQSFFILILISIIFINHYYNFTLMNIYIILIIAIIFYQIQNQVCWLNKIIPFR